MTGVQGPRGRVGPIVAVAAGSALLGGVIVELLHPALPGAVGALEMSVAYLAVVVVGGFLTRRVTHNAVSWLVLAWGTGSSLWFLSTQLAALAAASETTLAWWGHVAGWFAAWLWTAFLVLPLVLLRFPDGALPSRRWRPAWWLGLGALILVALVSAVTPGPVQDGLSLDNPLGWDAAWLDGAFVVGLNGTTVAVVLGVAALVVRFLRGSAVERLQLRWALTAAGALVVSMVATRALAVPDVVENVATAVAVALVPLAIARAIVHYRLYDLDRIIDRTVVYLVLSALLGGTYVLVVLVAQVVLGLDELPDVAVAVSTLGAAAVVRPLRRRVQAGIDRRFHRDRYDAVRAVEAFGKDVREDVDLADLRGGLTGIVRATLAPATVGVWLAPRPRS